MRGLGSILFTAENNSDSLRLERLKNFPRLSKDVCTSYNTVCKKILVCMYVNMIISITSTDHHYCIFSIPISPHTFKAYFKS